MSTRKSKHSCQVKDKSCAKDTIKEQSFSKESVKNSCKTDVSSSSKTLDSSMVKPCCIALQRISIPSDLFCNSALESSEMSNNKSESFIANQNNSINPQICDNIRKGSKELNTSNSENVKLKPRSVRLKRGIGDKHISSTSCPQDDNIDQGTDEDDDVSGSFISDSLLTTPNSSEDDCTSRKDLRQNEKDSQVSFKKKKDSPKTVTTTNTKQFDLNRTVDNQHLKFNNKRKAVLLSSSSESITDKEEILESSSVRRRRKRRNVSLKGGEHRHNSTDSSGCNATPDSVFTRKIKSVLSEQNSNLTGVANEDSIKSYASKKRLFSRNDAENLSVSLNNNVIKRHENNRLINLQTQDSTVKQLANKSKFYSKSDANIHKSLNKFLDNHSDDKIAKPCFVKLTKTVHSELLFSSKVSVDASVISSESHIKKNREKTNEDISKDNAVRIDSIASETIYSKSKNLEPSKSIETSDHIIENCTKKNRRKLSVSSSQSDADEEERSECSSPTKFNSLRTRRTVKKLKTKKNAPLYSKTHSHHGKSSGSESNDSDSSMLAGADTKLNRETKHVLKHDRSKNYTKYKSTDISDSDYLPEDPKTEKELGTAKKETLNPKGKNSTHHRSAERDSDTAENCSKKRARKLSSSPSESVTDTEQISESRSTRNFSNLRNTSTPKKFKKRRKVSFSRHFLHSKSQSDNYNSSGSESKGSDSSALAAATVENKETKHVLKHDRNKNYTKYQSSDVSDSDYLPNEHKTKKDLDTDKKVALNSKGKNIALPKSVKKSDHVDENRTRRKARKVSNSSSKSVVAEKEISVRKSSRNFSSLKKPRNASKSQPRYVDSSESKDGDSSLSDADTNNIETKPEVSDSDYLPGDRKTEKEVETDKKEMFNSKGKNIAPSRSIERNNDNLENYSKKKTRKLSSSSSEPIADEEQISKSSSTRHFSSSRKIRKTEKEVETDKIEKFDSKGKNIALPKSVKKSHHVDENCSRRKTRKVSNSFSESVVDEKQISVRKSSRNVSALKKPRNASKSQPRYVDSSESKDSDSSLSDADTDNIETKPVLKHNRSKNCSEYKSPDISDSDYSPDDHKTKKDLDTDKKVTLNSKGKNIASVKKRDHVDQNPTRRKNRKMSGSSEPAAGEKEISECRSSRNFSGLKKPRNASKRQPCYVDSSESESEDSDSSSLNADTNNTETKPDVSDSDYLPGNRKTEKEVEIDKKEMFDSKGKNIASSRSIERNNDNLENYSKKKPRKLSSSSSEPVADEEEISKSNSNRHFSSSKKFKNNISGEKHKKRRSVPPNRYSAKVSHKYPSRSTKHSYIDSSSSESNNSDSSVLTADTKVIRGTTPMTKHNKNKNNCKYKPSDFSDSDNLSENCENKDCNDKSKHEPVNKNVSHESVYITPIIKSCHITLDRIDINTNNIKTEPSDVDSDATHIDNIQNDQLVEKIYLPESILSKNPLSTCSFEKNDRSEAKNDSDGSDFVCGDSKSQARKVNKKVGGHLSDRVKRKEDPSDLNFHEEFKRDASESNNMETLNKHKEKPKSVSDFDDHLDRKNAKLLLSNDGSSESDPDKKQLNQDISSVDKKCLAEYLCFRTKSSKKALKRHKKTSSYTSWKTFLDDNTDDTSDTSSSATTIVNSDKNIKKSPAYNSYKDIVVNKGREKSNRSVFSDRKMKSKRITRRSKSVEVESLHLSDTEENSSSNELKSRIEVTPTKKKRSSALLGKTFTNTNSGEGETENIKHVVKPCYVRLPRREKNDDEKASAISVRGDCRDATHNQKSPKKDVIGSTDDSDSSLPHPRKLFSSKHPNKHLNQNSVSGKDDASSSDDNRPMRNLRNKFESPPSVCLPSQSKNDPDSSLSESIKDSTYKTKCSPKFNTRNLDISDSPLQCRPEFSDDSEHFPDIEKTSASGYLKKIFSGEANSGSDNDVEKDNCQALSDNDSDTEVENSVANKGDDSSNPRCPHKNKKRTKKSSISVSSESDIDDAYLADTDDPREMDVELAKKDQTNDVPNFRTNSAIKDIIPEDSLVSKTPCCFLGTKSDSIKMSDNTFKFKSKIYGTHYIVECFKYDNIKKMFVIIRSGEETKPKPENLLEENVVSSVSDKIDSLGCFKEEDAKLFKENPFLFSHTVESQSQTRKSLRRKRNGSTSHSSNVPSSAVKDTDEDEKCTGNLTDGSCQSVTVEIQQKKSVRRKRRGLTPCSTNVPSSSVRDADEDEKCTGNLTDGSCQSVTVGIQQRRSMRRKTRGLASCSTNIPSSSVRDADKKNKRTDNSIDSSCQVEPDSSTDLGKSDSTDRSETYCVHCSKKFASREENYHHVCSGKLRKGFLCRFCEKIFSSYSKLMAHKKLHKL